MGDVSSGSLVPCNGNANCASDRQGHGTHCAGTAGGTRYGVAPGAQVRSVKVLSDQGSGSWSWSYEALDWLATTSVRPAIASMSLGGSGVISGMRDAVNAAVNAGVTVVVAAGNDNSDACGFSLAYVPNAITVGSTTSLIRDPLSRITALAWTSGLLAALSCLRPTPPILALRA